MAAVLRGQTPQAAARAAGICPHTVRKWVARYRTEGVAGLQDRSSRPRRLYRPTPPEAVARIEALRRERRPGKHIAKEVGVSPATVSRDLKRLGLNKLKALDPPPPIRCYERAHPGELIHIDIKKLGRFDQPVAIAYTRLHGVPLGRRWRPVASWIGDQDLGPHLKQLLAEGGLDVEVHFGEPIAFSKRSNRKETARVVEARVREMMQAALGEPVK